MWQSATEIEIKTSGPGLVEVTDQITGWVSRQRMQTALLTVFCRHTSCSVVIQENAAPAARQDLEAYFARIAPEDPSTYTHNDEGPDDMPAHIRAALTQVQLSIPLVNSKLALGTWQGIYLFEHRRQPHQRRLALHLLGE
jgi:secondary thiamine-phosphate synthase enzyme